MPLTRLARTSVSLIAAALCAYNAVSLAHAQDAGRKYISVASWVLAGEK